MPAETVQWMEEIDKMPIIATMIKTWTRRDQFSHEYISLC